MNEQEAIDAVVSPEAQTLLALHGRPVCLSGTTVFIHVTPEYVMANEYKFGTPAKRHWYVHAPGSPSFVRVLQLEHVAAELRYWGVI